MAQKKSTLTAGLLGIFLGWLGVHDFYMGRMRQGLYHLGLVVAGQVLSVLSSFMQRRPDNEAMMGALGVLYVVAMVINYGNIIWALIEAVRMMTGAEPGAAQGGTVPMPTGVQPGTAPEGTNGEAGAKPEANHVNVLAAISGVLSVFSISVSVWSLMGILEEISTYGHLMPEGAMWGVVIATWLLFVPLPAGVMLAIVAAAVCKKVGEKRQWALVVLVIALALAAVGVYVANWIVAM